MSLKGWGGLLMPAMICNRFYDNVNQYCHVSSGLQLSAKCISTTFPQIGEKDSPETSSELSEPPASPKKQLDKISPEKSPEPMEQMFAAFSKMHLHHFPTNW